MDVIINGSTVHVPKTIQTITELINHLQLSSPVIIVEHNDVILTNEDHEKVTIQTGDTLEFVQFVGGG